VGLADRWRARQLAEAHASWQVQADQVREWLDAVRTWHGAEPGSPDSDGILLKGGERPYAVLDGAALIEPRRAPGHYVGGSQGVSVHIAKGLTYRVGAMHGTYVPGPEAPTPVDTGRAVVTDQRVTFAGTKATREWLFAKLIGCQHDPSNWTVLHVSNRQKASGIGYDVEHAAEIRFRIDLAVATFTGGRPSLQAQLETRMAELLRSEPKRPEPAGSAPVPSSLPVAGWYQDYADPSIRRYWDGAVWTQDTKPL
jgi:hypothetical protein